MEPINLKKISMDEAMDLTIELVQIYAKKGIQVEINPLSIQEQLEDGWTREELIEEAKK